MVMLDALPGNSGNFREVWLGKTRPPDTTHKTRKPQIRPDKPRSQGKTPHLPYRVGGSQVQILLSRP